MKILVASSEVAPFAKTGGLADVCGALPIELAHLDHDVSVIMPAFRQVRNCGQNIKPTEVTFSLEIGDRHLAGRLLQSQLPNSNVKIYFVEQAELFDRPQLYGDKAQDYEDNCVRFTFFCRAVLQWVSQAVLPVDVIHCNDWQAALIPALLKTQFSGDPNLASIRTLMSIHNMAYQGRFGHGDMPFTGIDWKYFNWRQMEFHGDLNLLKTGIVFADAVSTVSPRYALEIQTEEYGCGLDAVLKQRGDALHGILNGVHYDLWDPAVDRSLPQNYGADNWQNGKRVCKRVLQAKMGLAQKADVPLIGMIGRIADQKGWDLVAKVLETRLPQSEEQWAILGTGDPRYEALLVSLAERYPTRVGVQIGFSEPLARQIEAASDMYLMPSLYEPCGLNQMYSLKYGSVPVVRETGGLADTITDATKENRVAQTANGFSFTNYTPADLAATIERACQLFMDDSQQWQQLVETGMRQDWSWRQSAKHYEAIFQELLT